MYPDQVQSGCDCKLRTLLIFICLLKFCCPFLKIMKKIVSNPDYELTEQCMFIFFMARKVKSTNNTYCTSSSPKVIATITLHQSWEMWFSCSLCLVVKVSAICQKMVQQFLVFLRLSYVHQKFQFNCITITVHAITSSKTLFKWNPQVEKAFQCLKERFTSVPDPQQ